MSTQGQIIIENISSEVLHDNPLGDPATEPEIKVRLTHVIFAVAGKAVSLQNRTDILLEQEIFAAGRAGRG